MSRIQPQPGAPHDPAVPAGTHRMATPRQRPYGRRAWAFLAWGFAAVLVLAAWPGAAAAQSAVPLDALGRPLYKAGEVLVQLKPGATMTSLGVPAARVAATSRALAVGGSKGTPQVVKLQPGTSVAEAVAQLREDPAVAAVSPNYLNYPFYTPSDAYFGAQWALHNTGQDLYSDPNVPCSTSHGCFPNTSTVPGDDIDAEPAWDLATTRGAGVVVAVIDTGVDYTHPELSSQMWDGTVKGSAAAGCPDTSGGTTGGSPATHGGCDITAGTNDPRPAVLDSESTHGTHVAGIIAAAADSSGTLGVAFNSKIMALQVFPDDTYPASQYGATDADIITAINYAAANGANIINMSLGRFGSITGQGYEDTVMTSAVESAIAKGVLLVAAAGNGGGDQIGDNDDSPANQAWPANYAGLPSTSAGFISVAATDQADHFTSFSNYGPTNVTIAAPGYNILSTVTISGTQGYLYESGTSEASPMVAGVAALVKAYDTTFTPAQIKQRLVDTGVALPTDACKISSGKRVDAYKALANITSPTPCAAVSALGSSGSSCLITYLTRPYLASADLEPLRHVRDFLWRQGEWGRTLVRLYYRFSGFIIGVLKDAGVPTGAFGLTYTI